MEQTYKKWRICKKGNCGSPHLLKKTKQNKTKQNKNKNKNKKQKQNKTKKNNTGNKPFCKVGRHDYDALWVTRLSDKHDKSVAAVNAVNFALFATILLLMICLLYHLLTSLCIINTCKHVFLEVWFEITAGERKLTKFPKMAQFIPTQVYGGDCIVYLLCRPGSNDSQHVQLSLRKGL